MFIRRFCSHSTKLFQLELQTNYLVEEVKKLKAQNNQLKSKLQLVEENLHNNNVLVDQLYRQIEKTIKL